jgi:NADH:ubiquinone oxidoreductase subunit 5 (subunit L)/multisubunit Na+/H+ antiporter MnhA subunit
METKIFPLIFAALLVAAPLIYLTGRLGWRLDKRILEKLAGWMSVLAFLVSGFFLILAIQQYNSSGPQTVMVGAIALRFDGLSILLAVVAMGLGGLVTL